MSPLANTRRIWMVAVLPVVDFISVLTGSALVYLVRYRWFSEYQLFSDSLKVARNNYILLSILFSIIVIISFSILGLYQIRARLSLLQTLTKIILGIFCVLLLLIAALFFDEYNRALLPSGINISRFILATGGFFILYCVLFARFLLWCGLQLAYSLNLFKVNVLVIAKKKTQIDKWLNDRNDIAEVFLVRDLNEKSSLEIEELISERKVSEIYLHSNQNPIESKIALLSERFKIPFMFRPVGFGQYSTFDLKPLVIGNYTMIELNHSTLDGWWVVLKRIFDIVFSSIFIVTFSWLYLLIVILIKLDSRGTVFYLNERISPDGTVFKLFKFRRFKQEFCTDSKNTKALKIEKDLIEKQNIKQSDSPLYKIKDDPRMTRVGKFLEKTSLDEIPQFFNVLLGNMSVVGPRPHQPREVEKYKFHHYKVLNIKPGITGLAQINGRSDLSFEKEVFFDTYYVEHWHFLLDIYIIIATPITLLLNRHKS
jgi:exopolysaccharide biosynthesis polyprenyl glycosylphosphotransferase